MLNKNKTEMAMQICIKIKYYSNRSDKPDAKLAFYLFLVNRKMFSSDKYIRKNLDNITGSLKEIQKTTKV